MMTRVAIAAVFFPLCGVALADCGSIPFDPDVRIFEPNQRALIAWNGLEEILILSTDLKASKATKVLEVIPFPARPTVKKADVKVFSRAVELINEKLRRQAERTEGMGTFGGEGAAKPPPAGEITFHKRIGATDVSVAHVLRPEGFVAWVEKYLKSQNVKNPTIPEPLKKVVGEYLRDGFDWFAFNVISLTPELVTKQAIEYRFTCGCVYYPLRITRTEVGKTDVSLLVLSKELIHSSEFRGYPTDSIRRPHKPVELDGEEIRSIHAGAYGLLGKPKKMMLRIWEITGDLSSFRQDVIAGGGPLFYLKHARTGNVVGPIMFRNGYRFEIGKQEFTVQRGVSDREFQLRHGKTTQRHGPYGFAGGGKLNLLGEAFILLRKDPRESEKKPQ